MSEVSRIYHAVRDSYGYLSESQVACLAQYEEFRLMPVLARFSNCRFSCAAQYLDFMLSLFDARLEDHIYLRDLSVDLDELRRRFEMYRANDMAARGWS